MELKSYAVQYNTTAIRKAHTINATRLWAGKRRLEENWFKLWWFKHLILRTIMFP
jgi:hypothetical protein